MAARVSDWYFCNGNTVDAIRGQIEDIRRKAVEVGRPPPRIGMNAFIIARDSEEEAKRVLADIIKHADAEAVNAFGDAVKQAGKASPEGKGNWANSGFEDLVQYNDGFRPGFVGTPEQIAKRILEYNAIGVDLVLGGFLHYLEDVDYFGRRVLPVVRALENQRAQAA